MLKSVPAKIDKNSPVPIYHQLKQGFVDLIESGEIQPGELLPSENELSQLYQISSMTVRQAMKALVDEGYIHRERGRGTFVSQRRMKHQLVGMVGFSQDMLKRQLRPGAQILRLEMVPAPDEVVARTGLSPETQLLCLSRLRLTDDNPVGIHHSYLHGVSIEREELERVGSLYALLQEQDIILDEGEETLEAVAATREQAALLSLEAGSPLLKARRFSWDVDGNFVEYVVALYHADLYQYTIRLKR